MSENHENRYQLRAAGKAFSGCAAAGRQLPREEQEKMSERVSRCRPMNRIAAPPVV